MEREENYDSVPVDLIVEILSRLPAKSIARFRCVSKLWGSIIRRPYFTDLFLTMSRARPRILLAIKPDGNDDPWQLYMLPQPQVVSEKSPLSLCHVVEADFHMKFHTQQISIDHDLPYCGRVRGYASGLICLSDNTNEYEEKFVICNLSTGQYAMLPKLANHNDFLGFDPINKQFKVLSMGYKREGHDHAQILTLRDGELSWRKIKCPLAYTSWHEGICINGILYYLVSKIDNSLAIVYFDVRSEEFKFITQRYFSPYSVVQLINYKDKLGMVSWKNNRDIDVWVLKDVEKHEWSNYVYTFPEDKIIDRNDISVAGVTTTGEIILSMVYVFRPFYVFYYNPERNTLQTVEISVEIFGKHRGDYDEKRVYIFVDHVEDLKFNIRNATPIILPEQKRKPTSASTSSKEERRTFERNNKTPIAIRPQEQKHRPKSTSTSRPSRKHHQHKQNTFESTNKFDALYLLDDDV